MRRFDEVRDAHLPLSIHDLRFAPNGQEVLAGVDLNWAEASPWCSAQRRWQERAAAHDLRRLISRARARMAWGLAVRAAAGRDDGVPAPDDAAHGRARQRRPRPQAARWRGRSSAARRGDAGALASPTAPATARQPPAANSSASRALRAPGRPGRAPAARRAHRQPRPLGERRRRAHHPRDPHRRHAHPSWSPTTSARRPAWATTSSSWRAAGCASTPRCAPSSSSALGEAAFIQGETAWRMRFQGA